MGATTIEWTSTLVGESRFPGFTFNPWWGCVNVSPACDNCYAERDAKRYAPGRVLWGPGSDRRTFGDHHWNEPRRWDRHAKSIGVRLKVFTASMADVFDNEAPEGERERLWTLIRETPNLDWLLLTKRVGNAVKMLPADWGHGYPNVWLGATVVTQEEADRDLWKLFALPARIRFLSCEPLLGAINLGGYLYVGDEGGAEYAGSRRQMLHWVIAGGESGPRARPSHPAWFAHLRDQCAEAGVPFHFKQWGEWSPGSNNVGARELAIDFKGRVAEPPILPNYPNGAESADGWTIMSKLGKKEGEGPARRVRRELDGRTHDEYPT
jgi:protein gp37